MPLRFPKKLEWHAAKETRRVSLTQKIAKRNKVPERGRSYREELRLRERRAVRREYCGGAYGCPGDYFRGAPSDNCRRDLSIRCPECWSRTYADEEWIPYEKRDE